MRRLAVLVFLLFTIVSLPFAQTTYYVDPAGSDSNDGRSTSSPWQTVSKVNSISLGPGDKVLFRRGGIWNEQLTLARAGSGTDGAPIVLDAYGEGSSPTITGVTPIPGSDNPSNWTRDGSSDRWYLPLSGDPYRVLLSGTEYGSARPSSKGGADENSIDSRWRWFWNSGSGRLYVYSTGGTDPASQYGSIQGANVSINRTVSLNGKDHITFLNLQIEGGTGSVDLEGSSYVVFDNCDIGGYAGHYGLWIANHSNYGVIRNCRVNRKDAIMYAWEDTYGAHTVGGQDCIALRDGSSYWVIDHNIIRGFGHDGVAVGAQYVSGDDCVGTLIHHNEFRCDNDYGRAFNFHGVMRSVRSKFYDNYIHNVTENGHIQGLANEVFYNLIDTVVMHNWGTYAYQSAGLTLDDFEGNGTRDSNRVYNNTIRNIAGPGIQVRSGSQHAFVENNIVYNSGTVTSSTDNVHNIGVALWAGVSNAVVRNNLVYNGGDNCMVYRCDVFQGSGCPKISVAQFNVQTGDNGNLISGNIGADPSLQPDLKIAANSPARDAGVPESPTSDYWGTAVPYNGLTDIGAHEWIPTGGGTSGPPPAPLLNNPANGAQSLASPVSLAWSTVSGSISYHVQISSDPQFGNTAADTVLSGTALQVSSLAAATTYYWHVRSISGSGPGSFSSTWTFTTANITVNLQGHDISSEGTPVALINPPLGSGSKSLEVVRDGVFPPAGSADPALQYDTWNGQVRSFDWIGYTFPNTRTFSRVVFQEGIRYRTGGGWFSAFKLQVFSGGQWIDVQNLTVNPPYPTVGGASYGLYELSFAPVNGDGIRIAGTPAGTATYVSMAELRVFDLPSANPITAPRIVAPLANASGVSKTPLVRWTRSTAALAYQLQISPQPDFRTIAENDSAVTDTSRLAGPLDGSTTWYCRVRGTSGTVAGPYSAVLTFTTAADAKNVPQIVAPLPNSSGVSISPVVRWTRSTDATSYQLQISTAPDFRTLAENDSAITDTLRLVGPLDGSTTWYCRVRGTSGTVVGPYSAVLTFTTAANVRNAPQIVAPLPNSSGVSISPVVRWTRATGATLYQLQISAVQDFRTIAENDSAITDTMWLAGPLDGSTTWYCRVRGTSGTVAGPYSAVLTFATVATARNAPQIVAPLPNSSGVSTSPAIRWTRSTDATLYQLQISTEPLFVSSLVNDSTLTDTVKVAGPLPAAARLYCRVRAVSGSGPGPYSPVASFLTVDNSKPLVLIPALASPPDKSTNLPEGFRFSWSSVPGMYAYRVQISDDVSFLHRLADSVVSDTSFKAPLLLGGPSYFWRVQSRNGTGAYDFSRTWSFTVQGPTNALLIQNYPNPFNPVTTIAFALDKEVFVELRVYNILGQEVATLVNEPRGKGIHRVYFDSTKSGVNSQSLASGIYFYTLKAGDYVETRKMTLLK